VLTVGGDLAKDRATTAVGTIRRGSGAAIVHAPVVSADDVAVLAIATAPGVAAVALDAPFGWPAAMVTAVSSWRPDGRWSAPADTAFRLRRTDVVGAARCWSSSRAPAGERMTRSSSGGRRHPGGASPRYAPASADTRRSLLRRRAGPGGRRQAMAEPVGAPGRSSRCFTPLFTPVGRNGWMPCGADGLILPRISTAGNGAERASATLPRLTSRVRISSPAP
jgi:hypothetical protein